MASLSRSPWHSCAITITLRMWMGAGYIGCCIDTRLASLGLWILRSLWLTQNNKNPQTNTQRDRSTTGWGIQPQTCGELEAEVNRGTGSHACYLWGSWHILFMDWKHSVVPHQVVFPVERLEITHMESVIWVGQWYTSLPPPTETGTSQEPSQDHHIPVISV